MKKQTQEKIVIDQLLANGSVSRNWALANFISRLGAIIPDLKLQGFDFEASYLKNGKSKDYVYKMTKCPYRKVSYTPQGMQPIVRFEKVV